MRSARSGAGPAPLSGRSTPTRRARLSASRRGRAEGQSLVEFSFVLIPLFFILLGIIQFGFIFNTYVTMTNAAREGGRLGTIYVYDESLSKDQNDAARNNAIKDAVIGSMNLLGKTAPQFTTGSSWSKSGLTFTNGDLTITYVIPAGITDNDQRTGEQLTVTAQYHEDLIIPMIATLLPRDSNGRLGLTGAVTMVIN